MPMAARRNPPTADRILDAAEAMFAERGFAETTLRGVAAAVGIQNPSIYSHFASKQTLYEAVLERAFRPLLVEFTRNEADDIARLARYLADRPHVAQLWLNEASSARPQAPLAEWNRLAIAYVGEWFAKNRPELELSDTEITMRMLAVTYVTMGLFVTGGPIAMGRGRDADSNEILESQIATITRVTRALFEADA
jgi:AcrR family transcriptional regulator